MSFRRIAVPLAVAAATGTGPAAALPAALPVALPVAGPYGAGAAQVWILRPTGPIRSIVVFGHGWKAAPPSAAQPWVGQFEPWLGHLLAAGNAVIFPRYQLGGEAPGPALVDAYRRGLRLGFARLHVSAPVVVVGYSVGATLALYYAANAARWGLPLPRALDAVFPAGVVAGVPLPRLAPSVVVLLQVGDSDTAAGSRAAAPVRAWLSGHARKRYDLVRSHGSFVAVHAAVKEATPAARQAFWAPLDALIAAARRP